MFDAFIIWTLRQQSFAGIFRCRWVDFPVQIQDIKYFVRTICEALSHLRTFAPTLEASNSHLEPLTLLTTVLCGLRANHADCNRASSCVLPSPCWSSTLTASGPGCQTSPCHFCNSSTCFPEYWPQQMKSFVGATGWRSVVGVLHILNDAVDGVGPDDSTKIILHLAIAFASSTACTWRFPNLGQVLDRHWRWRR